MKKIIITSVFFVLSVICTLSAQDWNRYAQFKIGTASTLYEKTYGIAFQGEYGVTYKWINLGFSLDYFSSFPESNFNDLFVSVGSAESVKLPYHKTDENYLALSLHPTFDIIRIFKSNSRHSVKAGCKFGLARSVFVKNTIDKTNEFYSLHYQSSIDDYVVLGCSYEFAVIKNMYVGAFCEFFDRSVFGVSIRRNF
ncbi:MAG: hypothetical protein LBV75_09225 [Paludibacter sp.]|jgi:hypothetical protein|nr:hypothetical protein [Paludibacter sp.]